MHKTSHSVSYILGNLFDATQVQDSKLAAKYCMWVA